MATDIVNSTKSHRARVAYLLPLGAVALLTMGCGGAEDWVSHDDSEVKATVAVERDHAFDGYYDLTNVDVSGMSVYTCNQSRCELTSLRFDADGEGCKVIGAGGSHACVSGALCDDRDQCIHLECSAGPSEGNAGFEAALVCLSNDAYLDDEHFISPSRKKAQSLRDPAGSHLITMSFFPP